MNRFLLAASLLILALPAGAERIKDLAGIAGVRSNQLIGYGLVVGLDGTGDQTSQTPFTIQSIRSMLAQFGVVVPANVNPQLKNVAAAVVHASLPAFARAGQTLDITVSSLGNAKSLRGGSLLLTPLKGADGQVYALAQGSVAVGGLGVSGADGSKISVNVPSAGLIPGGATVEREVISPFASGGPLTLQLNRSDFTTANRVAEAINRSFGAGTAISRDATAIEVQAPQDPAQRVAFMSIVENISVDPGAAPARVVINTRTGTVVMGGEVRVMPAAVSHGSLTVTIAERADVSQPAPFSRGETVVTPRSEIEISEDKKPMFLFGPAVTLAQVVEAVNRVGAGPSDLVAILEALREAGALRAELVVI